MMEYEENVIMYEKITEIKLSDEAVYLFTAPTIAIILPIRIFSDTKEKKELTDFLENKTNLTL
ncbi:YcxB family protein [Leptotrichia sp. OH3620_COT-345]|uniref:YcxB family protein n=1 Tax=Leptotrichia sp. OH3620_COT-345 TaxID=2491048 RepID=UPI0013153166|nr:YcxB family protein [Leptotrichia sp. OH3620_COT-345]